MVSAPYEYRSPVKDYMRDGTAFYADELEKVIQQEGAETILGFIVEPIIGSSAGGSIPPKGYFRTIQEICNGQKIPIIADEVLCGSGRTGKFFASEHFDLKPDLLVLGKGLNGGYVPLSALLCREQDVSMMRANTGYFMHAQTYMQAPCMAAAGLAVVEYMEKNKLVEQASLKGKILHKGLATEIANLPHIGFITGMGLLAGIEFVEHKKNKMPFDRSKKIAEGFVSQALKNGLVLWPNVGQVDGINGDLVLVAPPLTISEVEIEELIGRLKQTITDFFV